MPTSTRFAVAVHVLVALCHQNGRPLSSDMLARSASTNPVVIRRLLAMLGRAGLTQSQSGAGGGATLARDPAGITLLEVFRAVEDPDLFSHPKCAANQECCVARTVPALVAEVTRRAQNALESELEATTVAMIAARVPADG